MEKIRPLEKGDQEQILALLSTLTSVGTYTKSHWKKIFAKIQSSRTQKVFVMELDGTIIGTVMTVWHYKITHGGTRAGQIEEVVISPDHQKAGHGRRIIQHVIHYLFNTVGCYRITLMCDSSYVAFYEKLDFNNAGFTMRLDNKVVFEKSNKNVFT